jgi:NurA-like 5'-3' nuclease
LTLILQQSVAAEKENKKALLFLTKVLQTLRNAGAQRHWTQHAEGFPGTEEWTFSSCEFGLMALGNSSSVWQDSHSTKNLREMDRGTDALPRLTAPMVTKEVLELCREAAISHVTAVEKEERKEDKKRRREYARKHNNQYDTNSAQKKEATQTASNTNARIVRRSFLVAAAAIDIARQKAEHSFSELLSEMKEAVNNDNSEISARMNVWRNKLLFENPVR